jgi:hypothetical protein
MLTAMRGDAPIVSSRPYATVLGELLVAALILTPLAAMLFPELKHCSGNDAAASVQAAPAARRAVKDPLSTPFSSEKRIDR